MSSTVKVVNKQTVQTVICQQMSLLRLLLICFVLWDINAIWSDLMYHFFSPHNWMAFVRLNKRHVMLCYVNTACDERAMIPNWRCRRKSLRFYHKFPYALLMSIVMKASVSALPWCLTVGILADVCFTVLCFFLLALCPTVD